MGSERHVSSSGAVIGCGQNALVCPVEKRPRAFGEEVRERRPTFRHPRLDGVCDRIKARHRGHRPRRRDRQVRIEDRRAKRGGRIATRHLHMRAGVGNHRVTLRLTTRTGGRRDTDHREQRGRGFAVPAIIRHRPAIGQKKADSLGQVERAAAADRHDRVDVQRFGKRGAALHHVAIRVDPDVTRQVYVDPTFAEDRHETRRVSGRDDARVGDDKAPAEPQFTR